MNFSNQTAEKQYNQLDSFINRLIPNDINLLIACESQTAIHNPSLLVTFNNIVVYDQQLTDGVHAIKLSLTPTNETEQLLSISMYGKTTRDTIVENGEIVKDTSIKLSKLNINNYSLLDDYDFFNGYFSYITEHEVEQAPMSGFWSNSTLELKFDNPFDLWYNSISKKNVLISNSMKHRTAQDLNGLINNLEASLKKLS